MHVLSINDPWQTGRVGNETLVSLGIRKCSEEKRKYPKGSKIIVQGQKIVPRGQKVIEGQNVPPELYIVLSPALKFLFGSICRNQWDIPARRKQKLWCHNSGKGFHSNPILTFISSIPHCDEVLKSSHSSCDPLAWPGGECAVTLLVDQATTCKILGQRRRL